MNKKIIKSVLFLLILSVLMLRLNDIFKLKQEDGIYPVKIFYEQEKDSIDVIFYGSSHAYSNINPAVLWKEEGIASFDLAGSLQPLWNTYYYMKESLKYQRPKVMVVELVRAIEEREYIEEARTITNTFGMKLSREKYEAIQVSTPDHLVDYLLGFPVYHSRYAELSREDFEPYLGDPNGNVYKGFYPLFATKEYETFSDMSQVTDSRALSPKTEEYLRKIIALSEQEEIPLVFMVAPYQGIVESEQQIFNRAKEIAAEEDVPFLDFNLCYEELGLDPKEDLAEFSHLNHRGSTKLSTWLAQYLKEEYQLPDRRGDALYISWDQNAAVWDQMYQNQILKEEAGWYDFLELISKNPDYTYLISLDGTFDNGEQPLYETLTSIGMSEEIAAQGGIWIHGPDVEETFSGQEEVNYHLELKKCDWIVRKGLSGVELIVDGENYFKTVNGLNILVYDNKTESFVTAVGFDAENSYNYIG